MREIALASKQLAAQLFLQLLDGPRQRRLRNVTFLGGAGEVQQSRDGEEVSDLVHFHAEHQTQLRPAAKFQRPGRAVKL
jgi:hypothetical protein